MNNNQETGKTEKEYIDEQHLIDKIEKKLRIKLTRFKNTIENNVDKEFESIKFLQQDNLNSYQKSSTMSISVEYHQNSDEALEA